MKKIYLEPIIILIDLCIIIAIGIGASNTRGINKLNDRINKLESHIYTDNNNNAIEQSAIVNGNLSFLCPYCGSKLSLNTTTGEIALAYFDCRSCSYKSPTISKRDVKVSNDEECADILKQCFISGDWSIIK